MTSVIAGVLAFTSPAAAAVVQRYDFGRSSDQNFDDVPDGWVRRQGVGFPSYVDATIVDRDADVAAAWRAFDSKWVEAWRTTRSMASRRGGWVGDLARQTSPLPPPLADAAIDRCLRIRMDGGRFQYDSPKLPADARHAYRIRLRARAAAVRHDHVTAWLIFRDTAGRIIERHSLPLSKLLAVIPADPEAIVQTEFETLQSEQWNVPGAASLFVRLSVDAGGDGIEDIDAVIDIDSIVVERSARLGIATDRASGVYGVGEPAAVVATVSGREGGQRELHYQVRDHHGGVVMDRRQPIVGSGDDAATSVVCPLVNDLPPGFYRIQVWLRQAGGEDLQAETSLVVASEKDAGGPLGDFGITLGQPPPKSWPDESLARWVDHLRVGKLVYPVVIPAAGGDDADEEIRGDGGGRSRRPARGIARGIAREVASEEALTAGELGRTMNRLSAIADSVEVIARVPWNVMTDPSPHVERLGGEGFIGSGLVGAGRDENGLRGDAARLGNSSGEAFGDEALGRDGLGLDGLGREALGREALGRDELAPGDGGGESEFWNPTLERWLNRLTVRVRTLQLGDHDQQRWAATAEPGRRIDDEVRLLQGFGPAITAVTAWPWMQTPPAGVRATWRAVSMSAEPPLTDAELESAIAEPPPRGSPNRWLHLRAIDETYSTGQRIADIVRRLAVTRTASVDTTVIDDDGLIDEAGRIGPLWLPVRTTLAVIGRGNAIGRLDRPTKIYNRVFQVGDRAVWMVWSPGPAEDALYLGEKVTEVDVWGRRRSIAPVPRGTVEVAGLVNRGLRTRRGVADTVHVIRSGPIPRFYVGCDLDVMRWRMSVQWSPERIDSLLAEEQPASLRMTNPTESIARVEVAVDPPPSWTINPSRHTAEIDRGGDYVNAMEIVLGNAAEIGKRSFPIDLTMDAAIPRRIRVYRDVEVGPAGVTLVVHCRHRPGRAAKTPSNPPGENDGSSPGGGVLQTTIELTNRSETSQSYDCMVFPPLGRQYQMRHLVVPPGQTVRRDILWSNGDELVGRTMMLRAQQRDGPRVLNYRFTAHR